MVVEYRCDKCNKTFKHKTDFTRHNNRLKPCIPGVAGILPAPSTLPIQRLHVPSSGSDAFIAFAGAIRSLGFENIEFLTQMDYHQLRRALGLRDDPDTIIRMVCQLYRQPENHNIRFISTEPPDAVPPPAQPEDDAEEGTDAEAEGPAAEVLRRGKWVRMPVREAVAAVCANAVLKFMDIEHIYSGRLVKKTQAALEELLEEYEVKLFREKVTDDDVAPLLEQAEEALRILLA